MKNAPKIIHYCWFGKTALPELALRCIASWKKHLPDYEIKEWNESNFNIKCCPYVQEAYEAKKYAFVSDYARYWILEKEGGLYFDIDVEVIKPLTEILEKGAFMGCEAPPPSSQDLFIAPGLGIGIQAHHPFLQEILKLYEEMHFRLPDGKLNLITIVAITTNLLKSKGLTTKEEIQHVDGIWIYPEEYFCPINYYTGKKTITPQTYTIHHYTASWVSPRKQLLLKTKKLLYRIPFIQQLETFIKQDR